MTFELAEEPVAEPAPADPQVVYVSCNVDSVMALMPRNQFEELARRAAEAEKANAALIAVQRTLLTMWDKVPQETSPGTTNISPWVDHFLCTFPRSCAPPDELSDFLERFRDEVFLRCSTKPSPQTWSRADLRDMLAIFAGWATGDLPELRYVEPGRVTQTIDRFLERYK